MNTLKIACMCNLNHMEYTIARYLRDMGHQVTLYLMEEYPNFYPENDTYDGIFGIDVVQLPWVHKDLHSISKAEINLFLEGHDFYFGSEFAPAFLYKAGIKLDVFIPLGTDLYNYPFFKPKELIPDTWAINEYQFNLYQKIGVRNTGAIFINENGDLKLEAALLKLKFRGRRFPVSLPYLYVPEYEMTDATSPWMEEIMDLRKKNKLLLISHGRCEFLDKKSVHYKGTDVMLVNLARFIKLGRQDICLVLLEYGNDWNAAKLLAEELGIDENVHWLPACGRKDIMPILKHFDAEFGMLSTPQWSYGVAMEAMAAGIPIIHSVHKEKGNRDLYPSFEVFSEEDICTILDKIYYQPEKAREIGKEGKAWFDENMVNVAIEYLKDILTERPQGKWSRITQTFNRTGLTWMFYDVVLRRISQMKFAINLFKSRI